MFGRRKKREAGPSGAAVVPPRWRPSPPDLDRAAADLAAVDRRFAATPWCEYRRLDHEHRIRSYTAPDWFPEWNRMSPEDVGRLAGRSGRPLVTGGLLSMHPDGYVREAAVRLLADLDDPDALPFLIVRSADWVDQVLEPARVAVRALLESADDRRRLRAATLLARLGADRSRGRSFALEALDEVSTLVAAASVAEGLFDADLHVRRVCARFAIATGDATVVLSNALRQGDRVSAQLVAAAALDQADDPLPVLELLRSSRFGSLRALALYRCQRIGSTSAAGWSEAALFDRSPDVRQIARLFLVDAGLDVRAAYRDRHGGDEVALLGLAEVGVAEDAAFIEPYLTDPRPRWRAAAVHALGRLQGAASTAVMLEKLDDPSATVVRTAGRALTGFGLDQGSIEHVWARVAATEDGPLRRAAFRVFLAQSSWRREVLACRAIASDDPDLQARGLRLLDSCRSTAHQSFTVVTLAQRDELTRLLPIVLDRASGPTGAWLQFVLRTDAADAC